MVELGFGRKFHDFNYSEAGYIYIYIYFIFLSSWSTWGHHHKTLWGNHQFICNFIVLLKNRQSHAQYHLLAPISKICRHFLSSYLLFLVEMYVFKLSMIFFFTKLKVSVSFESLLLNTRHGWGVVYFTVLAPGSIIIVLADEIGNFLLRKLGWMTLHVGWLERYWTNNPNVE